MDPWSRLMYIVHHRLENIEFEHRADAIAEARDRSLEYRGEVRIDNEHRGESILFQDGTLQSYAYRPRR